MLKQLIEYECPTCNAEYGAYPEKAGTNHNCGFCKTNFLIPVGLHPREVSVTLAPRHREVSTQEAVAVPNTVPVRMRMPGGCGEFDVPVTQGTADKMATTFLGALIMAIGVVLAAMLGLKKKS